MPLLLVCLLTTIFFFLTWKNLHTGILLIAFFLPTYLLRFTLLGIPLTILEMMIGIVFLVWLISQKNKTVFLTDLLGQHLSWSIGIGLFLLAATIGVIVAPDRLVALGLWKAYFIEPFLLFLVLMSTLKTKQDVQKIIIVLGCGALFVSVFAIVQYIFQIGIPLPWDVERRVTSLFPYPNAVGLYLGPIVILGSFALYKAIKEKQKNLIFFWSLTLPLSLLALFFAQSEATWGAVALTVFLSSLCVRSLRHITIPFVVMITLMVLFIPALREPIKEKITLQDYSGQVRITQWEETVPLLKDHFFFGVGLGGYPTALEPYHTHDSIEIFQYPHNIILNFWVETGLLGLFALAWIVILIAKEWVARVRLHKKDFLLSTACFAVFIEMTIHGLVDVPYFKNDLAVLTWMIFALFFLSTSYACSKN